MKVIFLKNIKNIAQIGDIKNVADGYAKNFLFARGIARPATQDSEKQSETLKKMRISLDTSSRERGLELVKKMENYVLEINEDSNEQGHLYGSVDEKKIAQEINKKIHANLSVDNINLPHHLKTTGEYEVEIELHPEVKTKIKVIVTSV